jgi:uncharacterized membrane protein
MTPHFVLNPTFQIVAAYIIFIAGFVVLFALAFLCIALVWLMYRCANGLTLLLSQSEGEPWVPESSQPITLTPRPYHK